MMSFEECQEWGRKRRQEEEELKNRMEKIHQNELRKQGIDPNAYKTEQKYYHPNTLDKSEALFWYVLIMIFGSIFSARILIWIIATIWCFGKDRP